MDVRDCVRAYVMLMEKASGGQSYNVGGDELDTIGGFLNRMVEIAGLRGKITTEVNLAFVRPIDIPIQIPNSEKCRRLTGWKPEILMEQTLTDLLNYWDMKIRS